MNPTSPTRDEIVDALIDDTTERLATLLGLACPQDPRNRLRLLTLLHTATRDAIADTILLAHEHGYTDNEITAFQTHADNLEVIIP